MTDNNYNIIKPVESLQNVTSLAPIKDREEKKRRQPGQQGRWRRQNQNRLNQGEPHSAEADLRQSANHSEEHESVEDGSTKSIDSENGESEFTDNTNNGHSIDYCA
jgi:hypothetical protein